MDPTPETGAAPLPPRPPPGSVETRRQAAAQPPDPFLFTSGEGGPWNALCRRLGLADDVRKLIAVLVTVACGPIVVADLLTGRPLLPDAYVRSAVSMPLLLLAERLVALTTRVCSRRLVSDALVPVEESGRYARVVGLVRQLWGAALPEALFLVVAIAVSPVIPDAGRSAFSRLWNAWGALVLFRFLMLRLLWRWAVWGIFCAHLSRVRLSLAANHPDRAGGLAFMRLPSLALSPALTGLAMIVVVGYGTLPNLIVIVGAAVAGLALALTPPTLLAGCLGRARFTAFAAFSRAALLHGRVFRRRIEEADFERGDEVGASEQTDFGSEVERVVRMFPLPYGRETIIFVALPTLLPFLVQYVFEMGLDVALLTVGRRLLG